MLYLFNSGARSKYLVNVFNTLHLPDGIENTYRYSSEGEYIHLHDSVVFDKKKGEEAIVFFVDRYTATDIRYYPLRKGKVVAVDNIEGKTHIKVELMEYFYVKDIEKFNALLKTEYEDILPVANPQNVLDTKGYLAFKDDKETYKFTKSRNSWLDVVKQIKDLDAFDESCNLFSRLEITSTDEKSVSRKKKGGKNRCFCKSGSEYKVRLRYYFEDVDIHPDASITMELKEKARAFGVHESKKIINAKYDKSDYEVNMNKNPQSNTEAISLNVVEHTCNHKSKLMFADATTPILVRNSGWFNFWIGIHIFFIGLFNFLMSVNTSEYIEYAQSETINLNSLGEFYYKVILLVDYVDFAVDPIGAFLSAAIMFNLFRIFGKRVM